MLYICSMKHYLYTHTRPDKNEIFYIGIGTKGKQDLKYGYYIRAFSKYRKNPYWKNIYKLNPNYKVDIILESDDYQLIKEQEIRLIALYGRKNNNTGILANMTDGGDGQINRVWSEESRLKASEAKKGKKMPKEFVEYMRKKMIGNKSHLNRTFSQEHRNNLSIAGKGKTAWNKGILMPKEHREAIKKGIANNKKLCYGCNFMFDSANYTKWHGDKCLIGTIKEHIPQIKEMYAKGIKILKIAKTLKLNYKSVYKLKENNLL